MNILDPNELRAGSTMAADKLIDNIYNKFSDKSAEEFKEILKYLVAHAMQVQTIVALEAVEARLILVLKVNAETLNKIFPKVTHKDE